MVINRPQITFNRSVYSPINQCCATGLERMIRKEIMDNGIIIALYKDNFKRYRIVAHKPGMFGVCGFSGVLVSQDGTIEYKETNPADRGKGYTRQLQALLTLYKVKWKPSQYKTIAGASCYSRDSSRDSKSLPNKGQQSCSS